MRKVLLAASVAALLTVACSGANAQGRSEAGHRGMFSAADSNNDGVITRAEFDAGRDALFTRMDANNDGQTTREEGRTAMRARFEGARAERADRPDRPDRDANQDGLISRDEYLSGPASRFQEMDKNNDGQLSQDERPQREAGHRRGGGRHERMADLDANNDGTVSRAEFVAAGDQMFQRLDANQDGQVTQAEAEAGRRHGDRRT
jgi:EF hand